MNPKIKLTFAVFLILNFASTIKSDHIEDDCTEVQCPDPELECPPDSDIKSSASDVSTDDEDADEETNPFDTLAADGLIEELYPSFMLQSSTPPPQHVLQKRSLQHRRREGIKIVPGDYRSFEPEFFKYHNHHQPHRKWKRDLVMGVQPHSEAEINKCCPEFQCVCKTCPNAPNCGSGQVAVVIEQGHGLPGSCCSKYECVPEMACNAISQPKSSYWKNECLKCDCFGSGQELCQQLCDMQEDESAMNCFSEYLNRPKMNGDTWLEDQDCKECKCVNGDNQCQESFCKALDCNNPVKIDGQCCKVCPETTTTSAVVTSTEPEYTTSGESTAASEVPPTTTSSPTESSLPEPSTTTATVTSTMLDENTKLESPSTTLSSPTVIISTPHEISDLLQEIDIIVVLILASALLVICATGVALILLQKQKNKKLTYSTIPSSESSQSSSITLA